jgi:hypothetical protein
MDRFFVHAALMFYGANIKKFFGICNFWDENLREREGERRFWGLK